MLKQTNLKTSLSNILFNAIRGPRPANLDCRISSGNDGRVECTDQIHKNNILFKGLDVVRQYAVLFERLKAHTTETAESGVDKVVSICEKNPSVLKAYTNFLRQRKTALDAPLHAVSSGRLRPQCAPDATGFLSDVYKRSTRAKKFLADGVQCGRSMIEMLGVLAITGVLSVGGISAFTQMNSRYKINETQSQISAIAAKLSTITSNGSYNDLNNKAAIKFHAVPDEMITNKSAGTIENLYKGSVVITAAKLNSSDSEKSAYTISVNNIPKDACIALATSDWGGAGASFIGITAGSSSFNETSSELFLGCSGKVSSSYATACADGSTQKTPMQPTVAGQVCNCKGPKCFVTLKFY